MRALLTGASGFVGRHVLAALGRRGASTFALGRSPAPGATENLPLGDPTDATAVASALDLARPDIVLHLAGTTDARDVGAMYRVNTVFAATLLAAAARVRPGARVVLLGSAAEHGAVPEEFLPASEETPCRPVGAYGISKLAQSLHGLAAAAAGADVVVARLYNAVGPGAPQHSALGEFARQIAAMGPAGGTLLTGDLEAERDFVAVEDAADVLVALAADAEGTGVVDVCSGVPTSLRALTEALIARSGKPVAIAHDPARRGVSAQRRHWGSGARLASLGLRPPPPDPAALAAAMLSGGAAPAKP